VNFFKPAAQSPMQIERRERLRVKGRRYYIFTRGILRWGMPMFLVTTLWRWYDHGWRVPSHGELYFDIFFGLVIWTGGGYWFGASMWKSVFEESGREV
jgi:hypothetical protein